MSFQFEENKVYTALKMAKLISSKPYEWLLLEILKEDAKGRALELAFLKSSRDKDDLYDYLMEDEDWDWDRKYIFVYSDPEKECKLL